MARVFLTKVDVSSQTADWIVRALIRETVQDNYSMRTTSDSVRSWIQRLALVPPIERGQYDAVKKRFSELDFETKLRKLHDLVQTLRSGTSFGDKVVKRVLKRADLVYDQGLFLRPYNKAFEYQTVFHGYTTVNKICQGGNGIVWEVKDDKGVVYALKIISEMPGTTRRKRFNNELWFCARNEHSNIIRVLDWGLSPVRGEPFYVLHRHTGSLRDLIKSGIAHNMVLSLFSQALSGVHAAHQRGIWHRDLKPENLLYDRSQDSLVVADFGIAHFHEAELKEGVKTKQGDRLANKDYAAPEQRARRAKVDHRADIYALGLILNEMFTAELPLGTRYKTIAEFAPEYAHLDGLVEKMIRRNPDERSSIAEIRDVLESDRTSKNIRAAKAIEQSASRKRRPVQQKRELRAG